MATPYDASTDVPRARRYWHVLGQLAAWVVLTIAVLLLWPSSLGGGTSIVIVSGESMEPTYSSGDLVIARKGEPAIGDVVVYAPSDLGGAQVVHRVIGGDSRGWEMQGDNNDFVDPFYPSGSEVRGVVKLHIPHAGVVTMWLLNPLLWCAVILAAVVLALWPSREPEDEDSADDHRDADDADSADGENSDDDDLEAAERGEEASV